jgi:tRNA nucleotidyltransferase/poly(A) polymerase
MQSPLFDQANLEVQAQQRFALQNPQMLRVHLGGDVLAVKGAMVSYQGQIRFDHEKAGSVGKLFKKVVTGEDVSLMRVSGDGEVFFASEAGFVHLVELHLRFHGYGTGEWTDSAVRRYVRDAGDQLARLHILTRADCTTRNQRKADRLRRAYDDLEARIDRLAEEEELGAIRPDLDGNQIMAILGIGPGREVGQAYKYLLELRMDEGPMDPEAAEAALRAWWASRTS